MEVFVFQYFTIEINAFWLIIGSFFSIVVIFET